MQITNVKTYLLDIPLPRMQKRAFGDFSRVNHFLVRLLTNEGLEGWGETAACGGPTWSPDCAESSRAVADRFLAPGLLGQDPARLPEICRWMDRVVNGNYFAKAAIEIALHDLLGQQLGVPAYMLLGGACRDQLPVAWLVNLDDCDAALAEVQYWFERGIRHFKLKLAERDAESELAVITAIRAWLAGRGHLRADANAGWDETTARRMLPRLADLGVEFVEQPVSRVNRGAMRRLSQASPIPIMADESVHAATDVLELTREEAVHSVCLKVAKAGGMRGTLKTAIIAEAAGLPCMMSSMLETSLGCAAAAHVAAAAPAVSLGCDLVGPLFLVDDIVEEPLRYVAGQLQVPQGPGLGVKVNMKKVARYARAG